MSTIFRSFRAASADRKGVTAAEYAILAVGIVIIVGAAAQAFKGPLQTAFQEVGNQITTQQTNITNASR